MYLYVYIVNNDDDDGDDVELSFLMLLSIQVYTILLLLYFRVINAVQHSLTDPTHSAKLFVLKVFYDVDKKWSKASNY